MKRWTEEEDNILINILNTYPGNDTYCFMIASKQLHRSIAAISYRYYRTLKLKDERRIITPTGVMTPKGCLRYLKASRPTKQFFIKIKSLKLIEKLFRN